jgi:hypothetical protein
VAATARREVKRWEPVLTAFWRLFWIRSCSDCLWPEERSELKPLLLLWSFWCVAGTDVIMLF